MAAISGLYNIAPDFTAGLLGSAAVLFLWLGATAAYRLFLCPIAHIPGPKLAALTGWYETYFDCIKQGSFWMEIEQMHKKYGPIVRISPWEVHVDDPDWNEPYKMSAKADKYHWYYRFVGSSDAAFGTSDFELHRSRRAAQQGYFTQGAVARFDPILESIVSKLTKRLREFRGTGQPVNLSNAYRSLATDVVTEFSFHKSYGLLESPDFAAAFQRTVRDFPEIGMWHRHFGLILDLFQAMPRWVVAIINPAGLDVVDFFADIEKKTDEIIAADKAKPPTDASSNIISQMLESSDLAARDKSRYRLALEVRTLVGAGTETTGNSLSVTTFHLLANPEKARRLKKEIQAAQNKSQRPLTYQELQKLPYLCAVISEGFRISSSVSGRLPRINTREPMKYKSYTIPTGTPISMTQKLTHDNPTIFPNPRTFLPERWLDPSERKRLEKYLQPFGRGSRACVGQHLAMSGIHVSLARIFGEFEMNLFDTEREDLEQVHDFFSPFPKSYNGLRVIIE